MILWFIHFSWPQGMVHILKVLNSITILKNLHAGYSMLSETRKQMFKMRKPTDVLMKPEAIHQYSMNIPFVKSEKKNVNVPFFQHWTSIFVGISISFPHGNHDVCPHLSCSSGPRQPRRRSPKWRQFAVTLGKFSEVTLFHLIFFRNGNHMYTPWTVKYSIFHDYIFIYPVVGVA